MQKNQKQTVAVILLLAAAIGLVALAPADGPTDEAAPAILGKWAWYKGVMQVNADGTCHWKGPNHEEHGKWTKPTSYLFNWGEKGNDWNYLNVDAEGRLSGKFIKWGGDLQGTRIEP